MKSKAEYTRLVADYLNAVNPYSDPYEAQLYNQGLLLGYLAKLFQDKPEEWVYFKRHVEALNRKHTRQ